MAQLTLSVEKPDRPIFWIIAGPNGSGKTVLYENTDIEALGRSIRIVNPDKLANEIQQSEHCSRIDANLNSVQRIERWLKTSIDVNQSVGVETVLSTAKYRKLVRRAKLRNFEIRLSYVILSSPNYNVERVKLRVKKGGHYVSPKKVRERYLRSLKQLPWFLEKADQAWLFDNSGAEPKLIGKKSEGVITLDTHALPAIVNAARLTQRFSR